MESKTGLLEEFNVRVLYDKLEDQNLHLASQLAQHNESLQKFFNKISGQVNDLKDMLNNLDPAKLEELERLQLEATQEHPQSGTTGTNINAVTINRNLGHIHKTLKFTGKKKHNSF